MAHLLAEIAYYQVYASKLEIQAFLFLVDPKLDEGFQAWNLTEHPFISRFMLLKVPRVRYDSFIYIPRLFPMITKEVILKEYEENSFNIICPMKRDDFITPHSYEDRANIMKDILAKDDNKIPVRILAPKHLALGSKLGNPFIGLRNVISKAVLGRKMNLKGSKDIDRAIVIHVHGGGFVSMGSRSHRMYLNKMVNNLNLIHFSIDYRLAPENMYPDALDDVWQAYLWIYNYAKTILGKILFKFTVCLKNY